MRRPPKLPPDAKTQALREAGALHPHPDAVRDDAFLSHPFFDPRDRVSTPRVALANDSTRLACRSPSYKVAMKFRRSCLRSDCPDEAGRS